MGTHLENPTAVRRRLGTRLLPRRRTDEQPPESVRQRIVFLLPAATAFVLGAIFVCSRISQLAATRTMMHDFVSYVTPASSFTSGLGAPYVGFWDVKPPLLLGHLVPWMELFGSSLRGFYVLYACWLVLTLVCAWLILRTLVPTWVAVAAFASATVVMAASGSLDMFFPSELPGLAFVLLGVVLLIKHPRSGWTLVAAAFAITAAGQFKDVYMFAPAALVPAVWSARSRSKAALHAAAGIAGAEALTISYLLATGSFGAYREVLAWKRETYPLPGPIDILSDVVGLISVNGSGLVLGLGGSLVVALLWHARRHTSRADAHQPDGSSVPVDGDGAHDRGLGERPHISAALLVLLMWLLLAAGFAWQANPPANHYVISLQLPTLLAVAAVFQITATAGRLANGVPSIALAVLAVACFIPRPGLVGDYIQQARSASPRWMINAVQGLERPQDVAPFRLPGELTPPGRCLQVAYGWAAGAFHHYGRRPSCSRFFLSKLVTTRQQRADLRAQVIAGGPAVVVYQPQNADLDVVTFEKTTFPWFKVLNACYSETGGGVYVARAAGRATVSACIAKAVGVGRQ